MEITAKQISDSIKNFNAKVPLSFIVAVRKAIRDK